MTTSMSLGTDKYNCKDSERFEEMILFAQSNSEHSAPFASVKLPQLVWSKSTIHLRFYSVTSSEVERLTNIHSVLSF